MVEIPSEAATSKTEATKSCASCGNMPGGSIQVGGKTALGWLECRLCGLRTDDGLTFEEARRQWNRWQA
jgi:formate dehydrogenase maturation protein FdhE